MPAAEQRGPGRRPGTTPGERIVVGQVEYASRVGSQLLLVGWHGEESAEPGPPGAPRVDARFMTFPHSRPPAVAGGPVRSGTGFLAALPGDLPGAPLLLGLGRVAVRVPPELVREALVDLRALAWEGLAGIGVEHRRLAAAFLAGVAPPTGQDPHPRQVALQLQSVHETLRDALPDVQVDPAQARGLFVDQLFAIDETTFYIRGWLHNTEAELTSLVVVAPEGARADITSVITRYPRPDVDAFYEGAASVTDPDRTGFLGTFVLPAPGRLADGWRIEVGDDEGVALQAQVPTVVSDPLALRGAVLGDLAYDASPQAPFLREHAHPAIAGMVAHRVGGVGSSDVLGVHQYGRPPLDPEVTVVVPLYRRVDFLEHQLASFVHDPQLRGADLVYVLDSPELAEHTVHLAEGLARLYDVPFRLVLHRRNLGFADANNTGAGYARGRLLLLLNSDVLPDRPGWLGTLVAAHDRLPGVGAVGPKLVYEDNSLQHAGMYFERSDAAAVWTNGHYFKGLHRSFPPACVERPVPALTGACLLLATELWRELGGMSGGYVQGDYEDSDLCLRLRERGRQSWYVPSAELYHLEGQSYPDDLRRAVGRYNAWLQTHLWDSDIAEVMREYGAPPEL